jgi:hypothetical protein
MTNNRTAEQAQFEDIQACLGNALVYLKLIDLRVRLAVEAQPELLGPAVEDVSSAFGLVKRAQGKAAGLAPVLAARAQVVNAVVK